MLFADVCDELMMESRWERMMVSVEGVVQGGMPRPVVVVRVRGCRKSHGRRMDASGIRGVVRTV